MSQTDKPFHQRVAETLIAQLAQGTAPWQKPWSAAASSAFLPMNPTTGKRYRGINSLYLMAQNYTDPRWLTYKQAQALGAQVRRGEKGTMIQYWAFTEEKNQTDAQGKPIRDAKGLPVKMTVSLERPRVFFAVVFNAQQIEGMPALEKKTLDWSPVERVETILHASGAVIVHALEDRAFYRPIIDAIQLPEKSQFSTPEDYYATALHELGHWTGHHSRLNRDLAHPFGSEGYAREELRAEITSLMLGEELAIGHDPGQHAAYVKHWIKILQDDPLEIFRAAADAEKMQDYIMGFSQTHQQTPLKTYENNQTVILSASPLAEMRHLWQALKNPQTASVDFLPQQQTFDALTRQHLGIQLPMNWSGQTHLTGYYVEEDKAGFSRQTYTQDWEKATFFEVLLKQEDGTYAQIEHYITDLMGEHLQKGLVLNTYDKAKKMAETLNEIGQTAVVEKEPLSPASDDKIPIQKETLKTHAPKSRVYISVPYAQKEDAKNLGAKWDRAQQSWYVPADLDIASFSKWLETVSEAVPQKAPTSSHIAFKKYLAVPYEEREAAKAAGAFWDKTAKCWCAGNEAQISQLTRWFPENRPTVSAPVLSIREEFAAALREMGCIVEGEHPLIDGQKHRLPVEGDKRGERSGFYVVHGEGHPAGYIKNHRTGVEKKWRSKGYVLTPDQKAALQADAQQKAWQREAELSARREAVSAQVTQKIPTLMPVTQPTPYLAHKGLNVQTGIYTDREGVTYIPAMDTRGKIWTMQTIRADGTKRFEKDGRKEGCFHIVGGSLSALEKAQAIVISEGYATAASISEALKHPTVCAFDAGNLLSVAQALRSQYPDQVIVIAGDNDLYTEHTQAHNPGKQSAREAALAVSGRCVFPLFSAEEKEAAYLSKCFTDFNDLATKSVFGLTGVQCQVQLAIDEARAERQKLTSCVPERDRHLSVELPKKVRRFVA